MNAHLLCSILANGKDDAAFEKLVDKYERDVKLLTAHLYDKIKHD